MARDEVSIVIRAKDLASRVFRRVNKSIELNSQNLRRLARSMAVLGAATVAAVAVMAKMVSRGSELLNVQRAFNRIAGGDGVNALNKLRAATQGLITDYELMKNANLAITLGAVDTIDGFAELASKAQGLGRAFGTSATVALDKFTVGLARLSKLRLDDLGITLNVEKANEDYAKSIGVNVATLSEEQKAIAFRTETMRQANEAVDALGTSEGNAADSVERLTAGLKNAIDKLSKMLAQAPMVTGFFEKLAGLADDVATVLGGSSEDIRQVFSALGILAGSAFVGSFLTVIDKIERFIIGSFLSGLAGESSAAKEAAKAFEEAGSAMELIGHLARGVAADMELSAIRSERMADALESIQGLPITIPGIQQPVVLSRRGAAPTPTPIAAPGAGGAPITAASLFFGAGGRPGAGGFLPQSLQKQSIDPGIAARQNFRLYQQALEKQRTANENAARAAEDAASATKHMASTTVAAFGMMAAAAVSGSNSMVSTFIGAATMVAAAIPGVGTLGAAAIGAGGGILSAISSRGAAPVRVDSYSSSALNSLRDLEVKEFNLTTIIRQDGAGIWQTQQKLLELERQDGSIRIVPVGGVVIGGSNG